MDDSDIKQKPVYSSKKRFTHKKRWIIGIVVAATIVIIGAILAIAYLLPKTPDIKGEDITIGATTITQQQLNDYAKNIDDFRTANPEVILEGDPKVIASDDLIMNAALKYYAAKYGQTVSNKEILAEAYIEVASDAEADEMINALGDALSLSRIRNENVAYQKKLAPYVLAMKSLFVMQTTFDSPYFLGLPVGEVQAAYDSAIAKLSTEILPLFNAKQSKEDITAKADVNFSDHIPTDVNDLRNISGPLLEASFDEDFRADGHYYNNIDDPTGYVRGDVGQLFSMDEKIATLKNVGDFTDVFSSKTGAFAIVRLESKTDGEFNSWQEMLESFKEEYAYNSISKVISDVSYGTQVFVENTVKKIASIGVDKASAAPGDCGGHEVDLLFTSYDQSNQMYISGTRVHVVGYEKHWDYCPGFGINTTITTRATVHYTCYAQEPHYTILSHPSGYIFQGVNYPSWAEAYINQQSSPVEIRYRYIRPWYMSGTSNLSKAPVTPGQTIEWNHTVRNDGPSPTNQTVNYGWQNSNGFGGSGSVGNLPAGFGVGASRSFTSTHVIVQDNVDRTLCRATYANPGNNLNGNRYVSSSACIYIPYNYALTPLITSNVSEAIEANTTFYVTPSTTNIGPTKSKPTQWQITEIVVEPGSEVPNPAGGNSDLLPCGTYFQGADSVCKNISSGTTVFSETGARLTGDTIAATAVTSGDYEAGTHICYAFSIQPRATSIPVNPASDNQWAHSAPVCLVVGKRPKSQVWGGDLSVSGLIQTSTSTKAFDGGRTFGSWVEYGIFATSSITGMASGSAFAGPGLSNSTVCSYSTLSFANADSSVCDTNTNKGYYITSGSIADVVASFPGAGETISTDTVTANDLIASGTYIGTRTGDLILNPSEIAPGKSIILKVSGTVTIIGNQTYSNGPYTAISQLPQLIIIANKIIISSSTVRVDAWLIADGVDGVLETCDTGSSTYELTGEQRLTINKCKDQLTVNGPVMAKQLWLRRTYGSGVGPDLGTGAVYSGTPAEIFNLRADAYLWSVARASSNGHIQTVYSTELPPRF